MGCDSKDNKVISRDYSKMITNIGNWVKDSDTKKITKIFIDKGYEIYFVGGCVRDSLLGYPVTDIDMSTTALPDKIMQIAKANNLRAIPTGIKHGTVTIVNNGKPYQITTFRKDVTTDGRHANVSYSNDIITDANRRDFTINALYADADGNLIDPLKGINDLYNKIIKFIFNPKKRILEDNLRILRFFRFHAWYGDSSKSLDTDSLNACAYYKEKVATLSNERVGTEMKKIMSAPNPISSLEAMNIAGVLELVMPKASTSQLSALLQLENKHQKGVHWTTRAAIMTSTDLKNIWKISKIDHKKLRNLQKLKASKDKISKISYLYGEEFSWQYAILKYASLNKDIPNNICAEIKRGTNALFPIKSCELINDFEGPELGKKINELQHAWITSNFSLTREELLNLTF